jgi:hypothetical protein
MLCDHSLGLQELHRALGLGQMQLPFLVKLRFG